MRHIKLLKQLFVDDEGSLFICSRRNHKKLEKFSILIDILAGWDKSMENLAWFLLEDILPNELMIVYILLVFRNCFIAFFILAWIWDSVLGWGHIGGSHSCLANFHTKKCNTLIYYVFLELSKSNPNEQKWNFSDSF